MTDGREHLRVGIDIGGTSMKLAAPEHFTLACGRVGYFAAALGAVDSCPKPQ